jgi:hypothetical protein
MQDCWKSPGPSHRFSGLEAPRAAGQRLARLWRALERLLREGAAQDLAEYAISLAVIGAGAAAAALVIRASVTAMWVHHARLLQKLATLSGS